MSKSICETGGSRCLAWLLVLSAVFRPSPLGGQTMIDLELVIVRDEEGNGVASSIFRCLPSGLEEELRATNSSGILSLNPPEPYNRHIKIRAVPLASRYYNSDRRDVSTEIEFTLSRRPDSEARSPVVRSLRQRESVEDPAERLLVFSERAARARQSDPEFAAIAEERAFIAASEALNVPDPLYFDRDQGKVVPSQALETAIGAYQAQNDLGVTRKLDVRTIESLNGRPYWQVLYDVTASASWREHPAQPLVTNEFIDLVRELRDPKLEALAVNSTNARGIGRSGLSALLFNELTVRLRHFNTDDSRALAVIAEVELYRSAGQALSVDEPIRFDPLQSGFVVSQSLSARIRNLQRDNGIRATGRCDYATLRVIAEGEDVGPFLTAVRIPEQ